MISTPVCSTLDRNQLNIENIMFIYMLLNKVNGKIYVGQTVRDVNKRLAQHRTVGARGARRFPITLAIHKYGWNAFDKFVLDTAKTQEELNGLEAYWIERYDCIAPNGYNLASGGGQVGRMNEETKRKIGNASRGRRHSEESKALMATARIGAKHEEETKRKMSKAHSAENGSNAKLNWEIVGEIRRRRLSGETLASLAQAFCVSADCISNIVRGDTWKVEGQQMVRHQRSKLTLDIAKEILLRRMAGESGSKLSKEYGISQATVSEICSGKKWMKAKAELGLG